MGSETPPRHGFTALNPYDARTLASVVERLFPEHENGPGAVDMGVCTFIDRALAGPYADCIPQYSLGLTALDAVARDRHGVPFADCSADEQASMLREMERGELPNFETPPQVEFFALLRAHVQEGAFADPVYGGNRDKAGWRFLGHPGIWFENSAEENLATEPVTKGGEIRSLADVGYSLNGPRRRPGKPAQYQSQHGVAVSGEADVVLVGVGAMGSLAARLLSAAGLRVVGLEAGPWRQEEDFVPDELGSAYYCRGDMGRKFLSETPRWRPNADTPTQPASFSLGRMMNSVGGSVIHWGGVLRRFHPHHFTYLSHLQEKYGEGVLPDGHTLVDWPIGYDDLEPYYTLVENQVGVAGDASCNPFIPHSGPLPLPRLRPFTGGELFREATQRMGLHPYPTPVAVNSEPYNGFPATSYCAWMGGFGPFRNDRWHPALTWVPEALATGNFDLRTHCRVTRILTDDKGHASGVEYVDANGEFREQRARTVILGSYTFENIRLMLLSGDSRHPEGLGNNRGQAGKHFMVKGWSDVHGLFPDVVFNAHTGPAAQMWSLDDYISADFDALSHGFIGGFTPNVENQRLPIQISREEIPPEVQGWGHPYRDHLRQWQHQYAVRLQPESLSYADNYLDLDPRHRDRSGLGLPVIRITYHLHENEQRQARWMAQQGEEILRKMGAAKTWHKPGFRVCSSHDLGGCRMGEDPAASVVGTGLEVHDTPGLYVYSGAVFPTCTGVNPTLTMWALCYRATEGLIERLRGRLAG